MIDINNISFSYGDKTVFKDFSLHIEDGEHVCLFGESGCGKTTLLRLILGLEQPASGEITGTQGKRASAVFQENRLLDFMSVRENISLVTQDDQKIQDCLNALGIGGSADMLPSALSGGMKRRAAIARALCADFDFLVLDEPFNGLDDGNVKAAAETILRIAGKRTIILVSHSEETVKLLNARIVEIKK